MAYPDSEVAFRVCIPASDLPDSGGEPENDFEAITSTIVETASILPNTMMGMSEEGHRTVVISMHDAQCWSHIAERVRQLTFEYERLLQRRELAEKQSSTFDWDDYQDYD
ncbi:hypothetical protein G6M89_09190 [Natronolimnobius sp. AArcel1]|uniref:hypothetical protein n=1 Tax=Natronolimnobius sp. AArcel1 TaxID=1679093 RepID=UPI0013ED10B6|nr:hypothetical protein [Natronolimnobius sp. AArcel1]NGM69178.1 hypothetical protein [Natronolimnobius sp. AArcel1]